MSDDDSSSEDEDYKPNNAEVNEAEADSKGQKRKRLEGEGGSKTARASAKVEDIWQKLKASTTSSPRGKPLNIVSICNAATKVAIPAADREWMQQLGIKSYTPAPSSTFHVAKPIPATPAGSSAPAGTADSKKPPLAANTADVGAASRALAAAKAATSSTAAQHGDQVAVTETRRFAGKDIQVSKLASVEEAQKVKEKEERNHLGMDAMLASLQGSKKVNVLEKSRGDWGQFKKGDAQVEEELEAYKKSGAKYLDKVDFLKRSELREYEAERDKRLSGDVRNRARS